MGIETESNFMIKALLKNHLRGNPNAVSSIGIQDQAISLTHRFASTGFILLEPIQKFAVLRRRKPITVQRLRRSSTAACAKFTTNHNPKAVSD